MAATVSERELQMDDTRKSEVDAAIWADPSEIEQSESGGESGPGFRDNVREFLRIYWKKRKVALVIVSAGIAISVVYSLSLENVYTSTTSLMPQNSSSPYSSMLSLVTGSSDAAALGSEALGIGTPSDLQIGILESRVVQNAMITHFDLMNRYKVKVIDDARTILKSNTKIGQDRVSGIITIAVTDTSPSIARNMAQEYVTQLNRVLTENSTSAARRERLFLEGRLKDVKKDLDDSSQALSQFSTKSKTIDVPIQARAMVESATRLQGLLAEGESQLAGLRQTYSEDNNRVKALEARNAELQRQLTAMGGVTGSSNGSKTAHNASYPSVGDLPSLGLTYANLERKVRVDEQLWETLTKQYEIARVQEAKEIPTIQVLDVANIPDRKSAPRRSMIVLACTFVSFLLSAFIIFCLTRWQKMDEQAPMKLIYSKIIRKPTAPQS